MRGSSMSNSELWQNFLDNIKEVISSLSFDIWFNEKETQLYSYKDNIVTITVVQDFVKKHLEERYMDMMLEAMYKVTNSNVTINIVLLDEIKDITNKC